MPGIFRRIVQFLVLTLAAQRVPAQIADTAAVRRLLADRKDLGIVVGIIDSAGPRVVAHGSLSQKDKRAPNGDTVFEIGSATKVFTAMLLADMAAKGEVALDDPVAKYLPEAVKLPKTITFRHLATHTSGLPRLPANLLPQNADNPYADYTVEQMYDFLSGVQLTREPGTYEYSNLGAGLLGHVLALRAKTDYETLVRTRILEPLGMKSTSIRLSNELQRRLAPGHNDELKPAANWDLPALAGAGALRSTANDMLKFLAAAIEGKAPMASMLSARRATDMPNVEIALGWHITKANGREIVWHNGGTGGYRSFVGFDPKARTGVVVLSNTSTIAGVDDIGHLLLNPAAKAERKTVTIDPKTFDRYVGHYELHPSFILEFTREGERFFTQATGQPKFEIFPESETKFFLAVVDAQVTFETDAQGRATAVVLHQHGRDQRAPRLAQAPPKKEAPKEVAIDPKLLDKYVGRYQLAPSFILDVTRQGNRLFVQATAQPKFEVFPMSETKFFYRVVDAQITFTSEGLVLHQNGMDMPAKRLP